MMAQPKFKAFAQNVGFGKKIWSIFQWVGPAKYAGDKDWLALRFTPTYKTEKGAARKIKSLEERSRRGGW